MKILDLEQGSQEWLSWRRTVITATDCPAILGSLPWLTEHECWLKKIGTMKDGPRTKAMERGIKLEPQARDQFIENYGINMVPAVVESTEYDFLGASLDGMSGNAILEIKCGGPKLHEQAKQGVIPQYYMDQMQHQIFVTKARVCFYYCYNGKDGICIEVNPDEGFETKFMPKARAFWKAVAFLEPPSPLVTSLSYDDA